jgi:uncharacterized protein YjiS (DUF1127 family)
MTSKATSWSGAAAPSDNLVSRAVDALRRRWSRRRTRMILAELDDDTLRDIGLNPIELHNNRHGLIDQAIRTQSGTARIVFVGR